MAISRKCAIVMGTLTILLVCGLTIGLVIGLRGDDEIRAERKFGIDHEKNEFLLDGEPFRYVSGSFHYFRALPETWRERLRTMRAGGLNAVDTYVEWMLHNPQDGVYVWEGIADFVKFIEIATEEDLYVILRPGPYICAERDNGGLPFWLFKKYPNIQMRTSDPNYLTEVSRWYAQLMPKLKEHFYGNGGCIIMVQVENEYGAFHACDKNYLNWLRDETEKYVAGQALLFTTDIPDERISCGKIEGVFATTDFGIDRIHEIAEIWKILRAVQPTGPLVNSEFYPGWLVHWQAPNERRDAELVASALRTIMDYGASVNFYMYFGGTNFGFTAGANNWGHGNYTPDITSYDYDAVLDEAGDTTHKYDLVRAVIGDYLKLPDLPSTRKSKKIAYGRVEMKPIVKLLSLNGKAVLSTGTTTSEAPKSFEELNQFSGLVLYETDLPKFEIDPTVLQVEKLHDRALVYVDETWISTLSRENKINTVSLSKGMGSKIQLLVENQGRINFDVANDKKGILGAVTLQKFNGDKQELKQWNSTSFPLDEVQIQSLVTKYKNGEIEPDQDGYTFKNSLLMGPVAYYGEFSISEIADSYIDTEGWGKGVAYLNGLNLGRYWPQAGPQITLYAPREALRQGQNYILFIEFQRVPEVSSTGRTSVHFVDVARLDNE